MSQDLEIERTFLAKYLPADIKNWPSHEIIDYYIPQGATHAKLRIRKSDEKYIITKKEPLDENNVSVQMEHNVELSEAEFSAFKNIPSDKSHKIRYYYDNAEISIFLDDLAGLVLIDFEFKDVEESLEFVAPDFCLAEVTDDEEVAGGILCHHSMKTLRPFLDKYNYQGIIPVC